MDENKRHIIEDIEASELPERIRGSIEPSHHARVTVEDLGIPAGKETFTDLWRRMPPRGTVSIQEAAQRVRALRDEWDA